MSQESFIYSFVARGTVVLAEYTEFTGNFPAIAAQCLQKLPSSNNKFTYNCDHHTFNFLVEDGYGTASLLRSLAFSLCCIFPSTCSLYHFNSHFNCWIYFVASNWHIYIFFFVGFPCWVFFTFWGSCPSFVIFSFQINGWWKTEFGFSRSI